MSNYDRLLVALLLAVLVSCNPTKQAQRKDKEALERVTAKRSLLDSVAPFVFELYPSIKDTVSVFLSGGIDSVAYPVPVLDQKRQNFMVDSLQKLYAEECNEAVFNSYEAGYNNAMIDFSKLKLAAKRPDTLQYSIVDKQRYSLYEKQIAGLREKAAALEATTAQLKIIITDSKKEAKSWLWYFIAAVAACVLSNGLWVFAKIKKPF